jgi:AAA+ ATPase superfamily predicted ATPase
MPSLFKSNPFYNRTAELKALDRAWTRHGEGGQMMLLYGRRRLGKTYLLQRYCTCGVTGTETLRPHSYYLAEQTTAMEQRNMLARQLLEAFPSDGVAEAEIAFSWQTLLRYVSQQIQHRSVADGRFILILDEFQYLIEQTPELASIIQAWWDREGIHVPLMVVLCGSHLSTMTALGHENAPLFGRFNAGIFRLEPLSYEDAAAFYRNSPQYSITDIFLMYGILGGTPRYHALVDPNQPFAEEIVTLLLQPRALLENEVRFLLGSEQIRDPAPYNAVLSAIANGETQFGPIQNRIGVERGTLSFYLRTLQELGWIYREFPFEERSERRALYRIADPFLSFWYRFVAPLSSALQFSDPQQVYEKRIVPLLSEHMGRSVFEDICRQWLFRHATEHLGFTLQKIGRYWSRDGNLEIDLIAELDNNRFLFAECKWCADSVVRLTDYSHLKAKVMTLPETRWRNQPIYLLFSVGGFSHELHQMASDPEESLYLVSGKDLLPDRVSV